MHALPIHNAQMTQPQPGKRIAKRIRTRIHILKNVTLSLRLPHTNLHVEKIPSLKTSFPTRPSTSPQLPSHSPSQYPGTNRSRETKPGPALPSPARLRKTKEEKRKVNAMLKPHPSFLSHTRTDKMLKRQTRKKKAKKESLWSFLPSHSLREKRTK